MKRLIPLVTAVGFALLWTPAQAMRDTVSNGAAVHGGATGVTLRLSAPMGSVLNAGENVSLRYQTREPAWVVVFEIDPDGTVHLLSPPTDLTRTRPGHVATIPSGDKNELVVDGDTGVDFVFALAVSDRSAIDDDALDYLERATAGDGEHPYRVDGDPFLAANMVAADLVRGIARRNDVSLDYTYFFVNERVDYPCYLCGECDNDRTNTDCDKYRISADFDRTRPLTYPLRRAYDMIDDVAAMADDDNNRYDESAVDNSIDNNTGEDNDVNVNIYPYDTGFAGMYPRSYIYGAWDPYGYDPWYGDPWDFGWAYTPGYCDGWGFGFQVGYGYGWGSSYGYPWWGGPGYWGGYNHYHYGHGAVPGHRLPKFKAQYRSNLATAYSKSLRLGARSELMRVAARSRHAGQRSRMVVRDTRYRRTTIKGQKSRYDRRMSVRKRIPGEHPAIHTRRGRGQTRHSVKTRRRTNEHPAIHTRRGRGQTRHSVKTRRRTNKRPAIHTRRGRGQTRHSVKTRRRTNERPAIHTRRGRGQTRHSVKTRRRTNEHPAIHSRRRNTLQRSPRSAYRRIKTWPRTDIRSPRHSAVRTRARSARPARPVPRARSVRRRAVRAGQSSGHMNAPRRAASPRVRASKAKKR